MRPSPEQIQENIQKSREKYQKRRFFNEVFQQTLKDGRDYIKKNRADVITGQFGEDISYAVLRGEAIESPHFEVVFAFKKPKDQLSKRVARGILGHKLSMTIGFVLQDSSHLFELVKAGNLHARNTLENSVKCRLLEEMLNKNTGIPSWAVKLGKESLGL